MNKNLQSDKKNNILMAAVKVLTNKGYYSSTMDDIVAESKMSKGAIYHYYSSKKEVYLAVIDMWENQTQELLAPAVDEDSSAKAIKKLFKLFCWGWGLKKIWNCCHACSQRLGWPS